MSQLYEVKAASVAQQSTTQVGSWTHISTPTNPATGSSKLYFKSDGNLYKLSSLGVETAIGGGSSYGDTNVGSFDNNHTLTPWWSANIPGLVLDGTSTEALAAFATSIVMLGNGNQSYLIISTQQQTSGSNPSADINIFSGFVDGAATGASGGAFLYSGNGVSSSGGVQVFSGDATGGNSGNAILRSGNATGVSGNVDISTGTGNPGNSGSIYMTIGSAVGTQGEFRFLKTGVPSVVGQVWTATGTNGEGYWANAAGGITWSTPVNANIVPDTNSTRTLGLSGNGATNFRFATAYFQTSGTAVSVYSDNLTEAITLSNNTLVNAGISGYGLRSPVTASMAFNTAARTLQNSGAIGFETGNYDGGTGGQTSGQIVLRTGNATALNGGSGSITLQTGSIVGGGGAGRGTINLIANVISLSGNMSPDVDNSRQIGSSSLRYAAGYFSSLSAGDLVSGGNYNWIIQKRNPGTFPNTVESLILGGFQLSSVSPIPTSLLTSNNTSSLAIPSGSIEILTGNKTSGTADSGSVTIRTGTATASRGRLIIDTLSTRFNINNRIEYRNAANTDWVNVANMDGSDVIRLGDYAVAGVNTQISGYGLLQLYCVTGDISFQAANIDFGQNPTLNVKWQSDTTANRPLGPVTGQRYFDTTLGIPIWYNGTNWINATGTIV